jgi:hypothetical protein
MDEIRRFRVFVASPGDVQPERDALEAVVAEINRIHGNEFVVNLVRWETHVHPDLGSPQEVVNKQIGPYDIFIGIMWNRFGTPTGRADSGTEEEFRRAYDSWQESGRPRVLFYFCGRPAALDTDDEIEQKRKVVSFRNELDKKALIWKYGSPEQFAGLVRPHLISVLKEIQTSPDPPPAPNRFTVFLADVPQALLPLRSVLANQLGAAEVRVLAADEGVPGSDREAALGRALAQADTSIHLLSPAAGPMVQQQLHVALASGRHVIVWVPPSWTLGGVEADPFVQRLAALERGDDPSLDYEFIREPRVTAGQALAARALKLKAQWQQRSAQAVLFHVHPKDADHAEKLISYLEGERIEPLVEGLKGVSGLEEFQANLLRSRALVFVFGRVDLEWVRNRIVEAMKVVAVNDYSIPLWGVYLAPPPPKEVGEEQFKLNLRPPPGFYWMNNSSGFDPQCESVRGFVDQLASERAS